MATKKVAKSRNNFECILCHYITSNKYDYEKHLKTIKHKTNILATKPPILATNLSQKSQDHNFLCYNCNKHYKDKTGLWRHSKKCNSQNNNIINNNKVEMNGQELILNLLQQNNQLQNQIIEMCKEQKMINNINNTIHTNSHNKSFNLNFFLNETCKDAMNITDFVDSIKLQLSDLEGVGELGYVEGISNIIVKNLKQLDITQRPVHCTDKKRETIYIKDDDKWEKDDEKEKMHKIVRKVADKNARMLPKFKEAHPDCNKAVSKYSDAYNKIIVESMGGSGDNNFEKEEKIIKKVAKEVMVEKEV
jgi:hypothetical protein